MKNIIKPLLILFLFIILTAITFTLNKHEIRLININESDALHYQILAVNFANEGSFPDLIVKEDINQYFIDLNSKLGLASYFFTQNILNFGLKNDFIKPPLYPLLLGSLYYFFGVNPNIIIYLNLVIICLTSVLIIKFTTQILGKKALPIAIISAFIYYKTSIPDAINLYPHFIVQLLFTVIFLIISSKRIFNSSKKQILLGVLFGVAILFNGNIILIPFFYFLWQFIYIIKFKLINKSYFALVGLIIVWIPWIVFANLQLHYSKAERAEWKKLYAKNLNYKFYEGPFLTNKSNPSSQDSAIVSQSVNNMFSQLGDDGFVLISKQLFKDEVLSAHNEFCNDGSFHLEWRYLKNSYYNKNKSNKNPFIRIITYYYNHPKSFIVNIKSKFYGITYGLSNIYYLSGFMFALLTLHQFIRPFLFRTLFILAIISFFFLPFVYLVFTFLGFLAISLIPAFINFKNPIYKVWYFSILSTASITILFIGVPRYIQVLDPLIISLSISLFLSLIKLNLLSCIEEIQALCMSFYNKYLSHYRVGEIFLMSGYFLIAAFLANDAGIPLNKENAIQYFNIILYIASVYLLNSYCDYDSDKLNPRLRHLSKINKYNYLILTIVFSASTIYLSSYFGLRMVILYISSLFLWFLYYSKPFQIKSIPIGGSLIHFIAGIIHFQIGYELTRHWDYLSIMISFFFATLLTMGHLNHELIDSASDKLSSIKNSAITFGKEKIFKVFYLLFFLSQLYWLVIFKWAYIDVFEFISFFYLPIILLLWIINKESMFQTNFIQKLFRVLLSISIVMLAIFKYF